MTILPSLPTIQVQIAFNPTNLLSLTQTWTDVTVAVKDYQTKSGKQHYLDRVESATLNITFDGRNGLFLNGATNGTGYIIQPRLPIKVTATWASVTYPVFYGFTESIQEQVADQVNVDLLVTAADATKFLSLRYMVNMSFWPTYAKSINALHWWRLGFNNSPPLTAGGTPTSWVDQMNPTNSADNATSHGNVSFQNYGALIYDRTACLDLTNGTQAASGYVKLPGQSSNIGGVDFWILGKGIGGTYLIGDGIVFATSTGGLPVYKLQLYVNAGGSLQIIGNQGSPVTLATSGGVSVSDGYWHHVGLAIGPNGYLELYQDGVFYPLSVNFAAGFSNYNAGISLTADFSIGASYNSGTGIFTAQLAAYIQEAVLSSTSVTPNELYNRYRAGSLLQKAAQFSGDRIAEILTLCGYGSIVAGEPSLISSVFYVSKDTAGGNFPWAWGNVNGSTIVENYYWDTPTVNSTALDLIQQITDTDIGAFYQKPDGTLFFYDNMYYGTWSWNATTQTGTWTPSYTAPSGAQVWSDDASSSYPYESTSLQILRDDADLWTTVKITPQAGVEQSYENTGAEARWGYSTLLKSSTVNSSLTAAYQSAGFLSYLYHEPLPRVQNVELKSTANNGANLAAMLGTYLGTPVTFKRTSPNASTSGIYPTQNGQINANMVVESIAHDFQADPGTYSVSFSLDGYPIRS